MEIHNKITIILIIIIICLIVCIIINQYYPIISDLILGGLIVVMLGMYKYNSYHKVCKTEGNILICEISGKGEYIAKSGGINSVDPEKNQAINKIIDFIKVGSQYTPKDPDDEKKLNSLLASMDKSLVECTSTGRGHNEDGSLIIYTLLDDINDIDDKYIFINMDLINYNEIYHTVRPKININDFELIGVNLQVNGHFIACVKYAEGWYKIDTIGPTINHVSDDYVMSIIDKNNDKNTQINGTYENPLPSYRVYRNTNKTKLKKGLPLLLRQFDNICYIACTLQLLMTTDLLDKKVKAVKINEDNNKTQTIKSNILTKFHKNNKYIKDNWKVLEKSRTVTTEGSKLLANIVINGEPYKKILNKLNITKDYSNITDTDIYTGNYLVDTIKEYLDPENKIRRRTKQENEKIDNLLISNINLDNAYNKLLIEIKAGIATQEDIEKSTQEDIEKSTQEDIEKSTQEDIEKSTQEDIEKSTQEDIEDPTQEESEKSTQEESEKSTQEESEKSTQEESEDAKEKARKEVEKKLNNAINDVNNIKPKSEEGKKIFKDFFDRINLFKTNINKMSVDSISTEYNSIETEMNSLDNEIKKYDEVVVNAKQTTKDHDEEAVDIEEASVEEDVYADTYTTKYGPSNTDDSEDIDNEDGLDVYSSYTSTNFTKKKVYNKPYGLGSSPFDDFYKKIVNLEV